MSAVRPDTQTSSKRLTIRQTTNTITPSIRVAAASIFKRSTRNSLTRGSTRSHARRQVGLELTLIVYSSQFGVPKWLVRMWRSPLEVKGITFGTIAAAIEAASRLRVRLEVLLAFR
jgi:hypothetical protein